MARPGVLKSDITDPVSGFFMMPSEVADKAAARPSGVGTKILIDLWLQHRDRYR
jgi:hypothetical protein